MAPNFKISFPLPRRPSATPSTATPSSQYSNHSNHDDSPLSHPGTKAERMLGTSEPDRYEWKKKKYSRKERKQLSRSPSHMNITLSGIDGESAHASDGFPFPGMLSPSDPQPTSTRFPGRKASSPLLGELYANGSANEDKLSIKSSPQARRAGSASTLRSHYDPRKVPLPVSQQTSASSARDMALRKGFPPISGPLDFRKVEGMKLSESPTLHTRSASEASKTSGTSKLSGSSIKRINSHPRRRPSVTDRPTLYPDANRTFQPVSPPPALINSTLPTILTPSSEPARLKWWQRKTPSPKVSPRTPVGGNTNVNVFEENFSSVKVNVKRPKTGVVGNRNWFDGLEDDEQILENLQHPEALSQHSHQPRGPPASIGEVMLQEPCPSRVTSRKSSFSNKSQRTGPSEKKLSFRLDSSPGVSDVIATSPPTDSRSISIAPSAKSMETPKSRKALHLGMDLQTNSFLELSSSDDDNEDDSSTLFISSEPDFSRPKQVNSKRTSHNSEGLKETSPGIKVTKPAKSRSPINRTPSRPLSKRSTSSEFVPPVPKIPDGPRPNPRTSSTRWREIMEEKAASTESTVDSGASSFNENFNTRRAHSSRSEKKPMLRGSKLMKVTSEEEKLLEAMRDKRASIRQDDFEKGFKTAMQLQDIMTRPKTAGADRRVSRSSTVYGSRSSRSPPAHEPGIQRQLAGSRLSASVDDLLLDEAYPFPEVPRREVRPEAFAKEWAPPSLKSPMGFVSAPKASPSLSFGPSDVLPSTPTSHNSPLTPPSGYGSIGFQRNGTLSPSRGALATSKLGHDRKRTVSSSVVMLDGVEQQAQQLDEENWAMDRW